MGKRRKLQGSGTTVLAEDKLTVETSAEKVILISVVAVYPSVLKYTGQVTGQLYVWNGAGDVQQVDSRDVQPLLEKRIGKRGCCGSANENGNKVFELKEAA